MKDEEPIEGSGGVARGFEEWRGGGLR